MTERMQVRSVERLSRRLFRGLFSGLGDVAVAPLSARGSLNMGFPENSFETRTPSPICRSQLQINQSLH
jgi:hypothetical protein